MHAQPIKAQGEGFIIIDYGEGWENIWRSTVAARDIEGPMLFNGGCIQLDWDLSGSKPELRMIMLFDGIPVENCRVGESWPIMTDAQWGYISRLHEDEILEGPTPWITKQAGYGYEAGQYLGYYLTIKNVFGNIVELIVTPEGTKVLVQ